MLMLLLMFAAVVVDDDVAVAVALLWLWLLCWWMWWLFLMLPLLLLLLLRLVLSCVAAIARCWRWPFLQRQTIIVMIAFAIHLIAWFQCGSLIHRLVCWCRHDGFVSSILCVQVDAVCISYACGPGFLGTRVEATHIPDAQRNDRLHPFLGGEST